MTKRTIHRRGERGVAMVEAGILAPIFAMMMMLTIYLGGIYETKYRTCMLARYATWSYASNACSGTEFKPDTSDLPKPIQKGSQSNSNAGQTTNQPSNTPTDVPGPKGGNNSGPAGASQGTNTLFMAHGQSTLTWTYSPTLRFNGNSPKSITTVGQVVCNTPPPVGMNIFGYLGNIIGTVF
jgi:hypothetical protein